MTSVDLDRPPAGIVVLPEADGAGHLDPGAWVESVRRPVLRRLHQPVAEHVARAREREV